MVSTELAAERGIIEDMTNKNQQQEDEARALLDRLGTERKKLEAKLDDIQKETHDAIVDVLMARTLGPSEVARRVQYDRQHVARIAKKANVPPLREATVVSRAQAAAPQRPAAPALRPRVVQPVPEPPEDDRPALTDDEAHDLVLLARRRGTEDQRQRLHRTSVTAESLGRDPDLDVIEAAFEMGLLTDDDLPRPAVDATEETTT